jgi:chemotaxis protein methyltransferase CheR
VALPADIVEAVAARLAEHAGLELPAWVVEARAAARMAALELAPADYVALIGSPRGTGELDELIEAVRVGETRLFRHRSQIKTLATAIVPALRASGRRAIRAWSAGCAAGQEPYTLAAVLARGLPGCTISVLATDVSADAIELARRASYPAAAWADVPAEWQGAFEQDGDRVRVRPEIAALVRFERANLVDGAAPRHCDLVWCRNVLIYFTPEARRAAVQRLVAATSPGGFLFVGYSESLRDVPALEAVRTGDAVYYVRRDPEASAGAGAGAGASAGAGERRRPSTDLLVASAGRRGTPASGVPVSIHAPGSGPRPATGVAAEPGTAPGLRPLEAHDDHTPPPTRIPPAPPPEDVIVLRGHPDARSLIADITARLGMSGLVRLVIDLDGAELLGDDLAPVLRRARAAAEAAGIGLALRTTRAGARRWLARHALEDSSR